MTRPSHECLKRLRGKTTLSGLSVFAALVALFLFQPAGLCQGGYDTTDVAPPEEVQDHGPRPEPQEHIQKGDEEFVPGTSKYYEPKEENDVQKWFDQYDDIRRKYESTPEERQYFESLASRPPGSGLNDDERKWLEDMAKRYSEAFNQMKEVEGISETIHLHRAYGSFLAQQSNLYMDYLRILGEPNPRDMRTGRPLTDGMTDKRRSLYMLEKNQRVLDFRTRQTFHITKNPFARPPGSEQQNGESNGESQ